MPPETYCVSQTYPDGVVRQHPRILFSVPLTLRHLAPPGIRASHGISLDISEGGIGALVEHDFPVGDAVEIDFCVMAVDECAGDCWRVEPESVPALLCVV